jgi:hypothetical protein
MGMDWGPHQAREGQSRATGARHHGGGPPPPYEQRAFTVGNVVGEALSLYRRFFVHFASIALAVYLVTSLISALVTVPDSDAVKALIAIVSVVLSIVGFCFVQGALTWAVDDVRDGRVDVTYRELLDKTRERVPGIFGTALMIALVLGVGGALIVIVFAELGVLALGVIIVVVAALFFVTRWVVAIPITVLERLGPFDALRRSWSLVRGHGGRAFLIIIVTGLISGFAAAILNGILSALLSGFLQVWIASTIVNGLTTPFAALSWTLTYFHLRPAAATTTMATIPAGAAYSEE